MFDAHRLAVQMAGDPYVPIRAARGFADGETIPIADVDWSGELLRGYVALAPGYPALASLSVSISTETKTWQDYKDECVDVDRYKPCDQSLSDSVTVTLLTVSWSSASLNPLPSPFVLGEPQNFYYEIRRTDGTGPRFMAGDFILTERIA